jgi:hypothetical protein
MTYRNSGRLVYWKMWRGRNTDDSDMYPSGSYAIAYLIKRLKILMTLLNIHVHRKVFLMPQKWNQNSEAGGRLKRITFEIATCTRTLTMVKKLRIIKFENYISFLTSTNYAVKVFLSILNSH